MKEKILLALKAKFKNLGFGDQTFDTVAAYLAVSVTEDDQIDNSLAGVEPLLKSFQSDTERRIAAAKKVKPVEPDPVEPVKTEPNPTEPNPVLDLLKEMKAEIAGLKAGKTAESRRTILEGKLKDAPESVKAKILKDFSRMNFDKDEDFNEYLTETETDISTLTQEFSDKGLSGNPKPILGELNAKTGVSSATEKYLEAKEAKADPASTGKTVFA